MSEEPYTAGRDLLVYVFGPFRLDVAEHRLLRDGEPVSLGHKPFEILRVLLECGGSLCTREALIERLWPDLVVQEQNLTTNMHKLRRALADEGETPLYIETVRGVGYRFIADFALEHGESTVSPSGGNSRVGRSLLFGLPVALLALVALFLTYMMGLGPFNSARAKGPSATPTVAVLPFENLESSGSGTYLAEGIQDTILTRLATLHGIRVVSRTSADAYSSHPSSLGTIARELHATAVLEGSVQAADDRLLINVQLIDAKTDTHLWAATYSRPMANIFDVEGDVAKRVAMALLSKLKPDEAKALMQPPTTNTQAYVALLQANHITDRLFEWTDVAKQGAAVRQAVELYRKAIMLDPNFALAYARLSVLQSRAFWFNLGGHRDARIADAQADAKNALLLDPNLPQAYVASGFVSYYRYGDYQAALDKFRRARDLLPQNAEVIGAIAFVERRMGHWQAALDDLKQAERLDPRNPHWSRSRGDTLVALRRYAEAVDEYDLALAVAPSNYQALMRKAEVMLMTGSLDRLGPILARIPADVDPEGVVSILRYQRDLMRHDFDAALADLSQAPSWVTGIDTIPHFPKAILVAEAWRLKGDATRAHDYFAQARRQLLESSVAIEPRNYGFWGALGLAEAGLGDRAKGIADGRRAASQFPLAADAMSAPYNEMNLAEIYTLAGRPGDAIDILRRLLAAPAGTAISMRRLQIAPFWKPLRSLPAFQGLTARFASQLPSPAQARD